MVGPPSFLPTVKKSDRLRKSSIFYSPAKLYNRRSPLICHLPFAICNLVKPPASGNWHLALLQISVAYIVFNILPHIKCKFTFVFYILLFEIPFLIRNPFVFEGFVALFAVPFLYSFFLNFG